MMPLGRIRCRSPSKPSNLATVPRVSRQAMVEAEGRDGCRTIYMSVKSCCCSMLTFSLVNFALLGNNVGRGVVYIPKDGAI